MDFIEVMGCGALPHKGRLRMQSAGYEYKSVRIKTYDRGNDFIVKPFDTERVIKALEIGTV